MISRPTRPVRRTKFFTFKGFFRKKTCQNVLSGKSLLFVGFFAKKVYRVSGGKELKSPCPVGGERVAPVQMIPEISHPTRLFGHKCARGTRREIRDFAREREKNRFWLSSDLAWQHQTDRLERTSKLR